MSKRNTIGASPLDAIIPGAQAQTPRARAGISRPVAVPAAPLPRCERITFQFPANLIERLRNAAFWSPGTSMAGLAEQALETALERLEKQRGKPFPPRQHPLRPGRRVQAV